MDAFEVIKKRISCRAFSGEDIEREKIEKLIACIDRINEETGLHFQIYTGLTKKEMTREAEYFMKSSHVSLVLRYSPRLRYAYPRK